MKAIAEHNGQKVEITLNSEQEAEVKRKTFDYKSIKTVEQAFEFLGINYQEFLDKYKGLPDDEVAHAEIKHIVKALNGGEWIEKGYYPWFNHKSSPSGFSYGDCVCAYTYSYVGSRLLLVDSARAEYAGKQFIKVYDRYIN
jgi:hypothetical protein